MMLPSSRSMTGASWQAATGLVYAIVANRARAPGFSLRGENPAPDGRKSPSAPHGVPDAPLADQPAGPAIRPPGANAPPAGGGRRGRLAPPGPAGRRRRGPRPGQGAQDLPEAGGEALPAGLVDEPGEPGQLPGVGRPESSQGWTTRTGRPAALAMGTGGAHQPPWRGEAPRPAPGGQAQDAAEGQGRELEQLPASLPDQPGDAAGVARPARQGVGGERAVVEEARLGDQRQAHVAQAAQRPLRRPEAQHRHPHEVLEQRLRAPHVRARSRGASGPRRAGGGSRGSPPRGRPRRSLAPARAAARRPRPARRRSPSSLPRPAVASSSGSSRSSSSVEGRPALGTHVPRHQAGVVPLLDVDRQGAAEAGFDRLDAWPLALEHSSRSTAAIS